MSDVGTRLKAFLLADATIARKVGGRVHEDHVPQARTPRVPSYIWFGRRQTTSNVTLDSAAGEPPDEIAFDLECVSETPSDAKAIADLVNTRCNAYRGAFGDSTCKGIFVDDRDANYEPKSTGGDTGLTVEALNLRVFV